MRRFVKEFFYCKDVNRVLSPLKGHDLSKNATIDVDHESGSYQTPAEMLDRVSEFAAEVALIRVQRQKEGTRRWNLVKRTRKIVPGSLTAEEICDAAIDIAASDLNSGSESAAKYRGFFTLGDGAVRYARIYLERDENGDVSAEDDEDEDEIYSTPVEKSLARSLDEEREATRKQNTMMLQTWATFSDVIHRMGAAQALVIEKQAAVGAAMASTMKGSAEAMLHAGELYREGQGRRVEQDRIAMETRLVEREMDQADQRLGLATSLLPIGAFAVLQKMGVPAEHAATAIGAMVAMQNQGQPGQAPPAMGPGPSPMGLPDGGALGAVQGMAGQMTGQPPAPAQRAPQAQPQGVPAQPVSRPAGWQYPGPFDLDDVPGDDMDGAAGLLGCWFAERDEAEEHALRAVVGGSLYDTLRAAPTRGDQAASAALRAFGAQVAGLGMQALQLLGQIRQAVGAEAVGEFQSLVNRARTGEI